MSDTPTLLPNNASDQERAIEQAMARLQDVSVPLRSLWNPDTCPAALLPWLAWALSIDAWKDYWPESVKRARIKAAVDIQRHKGSAQSVLDVVNSFGASMTLREWWELSPQGTPHTFEVVLVIGASVPNTAAYQQDIIDEITRTKPVRSHFTFTVGLSGEAGLGFLGAARPISYTRLQFEEAP